jgi:hypothetical protein
MGSSFWLCTDEAKPIENRTKAAAKVLLRILRVGKAWLKPRGRRLRAKWRHTFVTAHIPRHAVIDKTPSIDLETSFAYAPKHLTGQYRSTS